MQLNLAIIAAILSVSSASALVASPKGVSGLLSQLKKVNKYTSTVLKDIQNTSGSDLIGDIGIAKDAKTLSDALDTAIKVAKTLETSDVSEKNGQAIYSSLKDNSKTVKSICERLVELKPAFTKAGVAGEVGTALKGLPPRFVNINKATSATAPSDLESKSKALIKTYQTSLKICTSNYPA